MIIYADILFLINAVITYILLLCTALFLKIKPKRVRLLLSAVFGGIYAFTLFLNINSALGFFFKFFSCALIIFFAFGFKNFTFFFKSFIIFFIMNFFLTGIVLALSFADSADFYSNVYINYINVNPTILIISSVIAYLLILLVNKIILTHITKNKIYTVLVYYNNETYKFYGYLDTGNSLSEPFSAFPVILIKKGKIKITDEYNKRIIPYSSVGGDGILYAFRAKIEIRDKNIVTDRVYLAESDNAFSASNYDIILNEKIFSETE